MSSPSHSDNEGSASKRKRTKPWSPQEDLLVRDLVKKHGGSDEELATLSSANIKWLTIGSLVPGRTGKQCRERWHNLLNPQVNKQSWSPEEDSLIVSCLQTMGTKWSDIAKMMTGRTDNAIKNRWYSTVRRVERYKRAGQHKSMFATPTDIRKNNNPLFHFCLASFSLGKKNMASFGPGEMGGIPTTAAAATGANGTPTQAMLATPADSTGSANWMHMQQLNGQSLGGDSTTVSLSYPSMTNVTVASAVDAVELNAALQTPTRPTSRARTPASQAGDSSSASPLFANALSARRCITPPQMLALPTSPPLPFQNIRNGSAAGSKRKSGAAAKAAANSSNKKQKAANGAAIKTEGGDAGNDTLPLQMQVEFVQSVSEEARQLQYEMVSPQSSKLLSVPNSTLQSPPSNASTPSPLSHNTPGSISPFSALSPCFPLPPTPPTYASPPNTASATTSASSHATSSYTLLHGNSNTFPMPSPAANGNGNLSQQFQNAAAQNGTGNTNTANGGNSLPPQAPQTPSAYTTFLNSPLPNGRPTLSSGLSGMGASTTGGSFSPSTMLQFGAPTPGVTGPGGDSGPFSHFMSLQTPSVGGSFSSSFPLASPALQGQQSYGSTSFPLPSPAVGGGLGLSSPGPFPMTSPFLRQNSSVTGPYSSGLGGPKSARKSFDATAAIANYNAAAAATNAAIAASSASATASTTAASSTTLGVRATEKKKK